MKTTKNFRLSNSEVKKAAKQEVNVINTNPTYLMRKLNKIATGKDTDAKEVEGYSREAVKELYDRLQEAFNCGGFWWGSILAVEGYCITAAREVTFAEGDENQEDVKGMYTSGGRIHTKIINGVMHSLKEASVWSFANIIASASLKLKFAEAAAKENSNLFSWQAAQAAAKKKQQEAKKEERKQQRKQEAAAKKQEAEAAKKLAKQIADLKKKVAEGTLTEEAAAKEVTLLLAV